MLKPFDERDLHAQLQVALHRHDAERRLRRACEGARALEAAILRSPVMVLQWGADEGRPVLYASENVARLGYSADDFMSGRVSWPGITHPVDLPRLLADGILHLTHGVYEYVQEYRLITRSHEIRWVHDVTHVVRDARGEVRHLEGVIWDVTEGRQYEQSLQRLNAALAEALRAGDGATPCGDAESRRS